MTVGSIGLFQPVTPAGREHIVMGRGDEASGNSRSRRGCAASTRSVDVGLCPRERKDSCTFGSPSVLGVDGWLGCGRVGLSFGVGCQVGRVDGTSRRRHAKAEQVTLRRTTRICHVTCKVLCLLEGGLHGAVTSQGLEDVRHSPARSGSTELLLHVVDLLFAANPTVPTRQGNE